MNLRRLLPSLIGLALVASACSSGPGSREDLVTALTRDDTFSSAEASCIADAVFAEYGDDEDALTIISRAGSYEEITGTDGVEGFDQFFSNAIAACTNR
ncbi:MAG: hypothetical protein AAFN30_13095 [Actinomycetota bacterium]